MKVGIIGAGNVGQTLGGGLAKAGHEVLYGVRDPKAEKYAELAGAVTVREAVETADAIIVATPWAHTEDAVRSAGDFGGKPLLDATNPIGPGFVLTHGHDDSGAEQVQRWATNARVVKVFNSTGRENMADPSYGDRRGAMLVCGDDDDACAVAKTLAEDVGFETVVAGDLKEARLLEPLAMLWIKLAMVRGEGRNFAFGFLRR